MSILKLNIPENSKQRVWITSDTHYGHKNICRGTTDWRMPDGSIPVEQTRDYKTIDDMNDDIVNSINNIVDQDDILIHLGDWSFGGIENIELFRGRVICKNIYHILGNHDHHIQKNKENTQRFFINVFDYVDLQYNKELIILSHYPISSWNGVNKGVIHLHGHTHLPHEKKNLVGRRMDVGMDGHPEFRPYDLDLECIRVLKKKPIESEFSKYDHHLDEINGKIG